MRLPRVAAVALLAAGVALSTPAWGASPLEGRWVNGSGRLVEIFASGNRSARSSARLTIR